MNATFVMGLGAQVMWLVVKLTGPILLIGLVIGLLVSVFQATTQIQEQTLAFVPKIIAVIIAFLFFGPWMLATVLNFTASIFGNLTSFVK
jgi:flagellar biosynthesis protein FliQ